jgi:hypothetical protein
MGVSTVLFCRCRSGRKSVLRGIRKFLILILILILPSDPFRFGGMRTNVDHEKLEVYQESSFFELARGSVLECAACLEVPRVKKRIKQGEADSGKLILIGIVAMLVGLIQSTSPSRGYEASAE